MEMRGCLRISEGHSLICFYHSQMYFIPEGDLAHTTMRGRVDEGQREARPLIRVLAINAHHWLGVLLAVALRTLAAPTPSCA